MSEARDRELRRLEKTRALNIAWRDEVVNLKQIVVEQREELLKEKLAKEQLQHQILLMSNAVNGNEIWEALFSLTEGCVPEEMTEELCDDLAKWINSVLFGKKEK